jgi:AraC-like DNA-binding protein
LVLPDKSGISSPDFFLIKVSSRVDIGYPPFLILYQTSGMNRSNLNRRLRSIKNQDISQFIREIRLNKAMTMLQNNEGTAAEIAFRVGFGSPTYFNKCAHDYYGFTHGEVRKKESLSSEGEQPGGSLNQPG